MVTNAKFYRNSTSTDVIYVAESERRGAHISRRNRRYTARRHGMRFAPAVIGSLLLVILAVFSVSIVRSKAADSYPTYKYYTSIRIEDGDSLWEIAGRYADTGYESREEYIQELKTVNQLTDTTLRSGQYLMVPYYSGDYKY